MSNIVNTIKIQNLNSTTPTVLLVQDARLNNFVTEMPTNPSNGDLVVYIGESTESYDFGRVYKYVVGETASSWQALYITGVKGDDGIGISDITVITNGGEDADETVMTITYSNDEEDTFNLGNLKGDVASFQIVDGKLLYRYSSEESWAELGQVKGADGASLSYEELNEELKEELKGPAGTDGTAIYLISDLTYSNTENLSSVAESWAQENADVSSSDPDYTNKIFVANKFNDALESSKTTYFLQHNGDEWIELPLASTLNYVQGNITYYTSETNVDAVENNTFCDLGYRRPPLSGDLLLTADGKHYIYKLDDNSEYNWILLDPEQN